MQPDWYPAWRDEAFEQLTAKNARLEKDFRLGHWSRYDYDLTAGTLSFSDRAGVKVVSEIQIAGSTSAKAETWLWAWANSKLPGNLLGDAKLVRAFGEEKGIDDLAQAYVTDASGDLEGSWLGPDRGLWFGYATRLEPTDRRAARAERCIWFSRAPDGRANRYLFVFRNSGRKAPGKSPSRSHFFWNCPGAV